MNCSLGTERPLRQLLACLQLVRSAGTWLSYYGTVCAVTDHSVKLSGLSSFLRLGDRLRVTSEFGFFDGEIVRIDADVSTMMMYQGKPEIFLGSKAKLVSRPYTAPDISWMGRVMNALCEPLDGKGTLVTGDTQYQIDNDALPSMDRSRTGSRIITGIRSIDVFTPICEGQRIGIFAGTGVGKTTLLGMLSMITLFDVIVVALVGERGREVREFIDDVIGDNLHRCIVVVSTSDQTALMRRRAAMTATCIAEYFRDSGRRVGLIVDSLGRFAQADRDIRTAAGDLPVARGFPPQVFSSISRLVERAGPGRSGPGAITAFYTVLVDGDDRNEPVSDHVRGTLDGHVVLSRTIAERGRFPAIDIQRSLSRLATVAYSEEEASLSANFRRSVGLFEDSEDLRTIGAYTQGTNPPLDQAIELVPRLYNWLQQGPRSAMDLSPFDSIKLLLKQLHAE